MNNNYRFINMNRQDKNVINLLFYPNTRIYNEKLFFTKLFSKSGLIHKLSFIFRNNIFYISLSYNNVVNFIKIKKKYGKWSINENIINMNRDYYMKIIINTKSKKHIYNLFSLFGNIKEIIKFKSKNKYILNFNSFKGVYLAKKYLSNFNYNKSLIKIDSIQNFNFIDNKHEKFLINKNLFRFKKNNNYEINTPNNLVFFKIIGKNYDHLKFYNFIKDICDIIEFKILKQDRNKIYYIVKFPNKEFATKAIIILHNKNIIADNHKFKIEAIYTHKKYN